MEDESDKAAAQPFKKTACEIEEHQSAPPATPLLLHKCAATSTPEALTTTESEWASVTSMHASEIEAELIEPCAGCHTREAGMTCTWCEQHRYCSTNCMNACACRDDDAQLCGACHKHQALSNTTCPGCGQQYCSINCGMACGCGVWD